MRSPMTKKLRRDIVEWYDRLPLPLLLLVVFDKSVADPALIMVVFRCFYEPRVFVTVMISYEYVYDMSVVRVHNVESGVHEFSSHVRSKVRIVLSSYTFGNNCIS